MSASSRGNAGSLRGTAGRPGPARPAALREPEDPNLVAAGALLDLALVHASEHARVAYRRAARGVLALERPLAEVAASDGLRSIRYVGPSSERILFQILAEGRSEIVDRAVEESGRRTAVEEARALRLHFLSRAAVAEILRAHVPGGIHREHYRGDLQMHSRWSDGAEPIAALAAAAEARGDRYLAVTDHGYGLPIAHGMSMAQVGRQHVEIDRLNERLAGRFRVLKGIEANLLADGRVDMTADELARFEVVVAAPHSVLRRRDDQTPRMIAAVRQPTIHVLGHPRGRMMSRLGVQAHWDDVFEEAARRNVAIELDGDPWRQDLDGTLARRALRAGCVFALDSDAHSGAELAYTDYALAHARLAGIPPERVINTWPVEALLAWTKDRPAGLRGRVPHVVAPTAATSRGTPATKTPKRAATKPRTRVAASRAAPSRASGRAARAPARPRSAEGRR